jgi:SAM-dependent methyltransferase
VSEAIFRADYARLYDAMYGSKDYTRECDAVEGAVRRYGDGGAYRALLDLGCGTGNHSVPLARRGYDVTGVDLSADMVAIARRKAESAGIVARFEAGDMRSASLGRSFDVAVIMFAALGYLIADRDVAAGLANVKRHLRPGGLLLFDVWNRTTLLREGARDRITVSDEPGRQLIKAALRTLDPSGTHVNVRMRVWDIAGTTVTASADETHRMRPFTQAELERFLREAGLAPRAFFAFPDLDTAASDASFDLGVVASA